MWARERGARVTGVDLGLDQLRWARRLPNGDALGLVQANARALPYRDATFDRVMSVEMMEHVYPPRSSARVRRDRARAEAARSRRAARRRTRRRRSSGRSASRCGGRRSGVPCHRRASRRRRTTRSRTTRIATTIRCRCASWPTGSRRRARGARRASLPVGAQDASRSPARRGRAPPSALSEALPIVRGLGATTLVWAEKRVSAQVSP